MQIRISGESYDADQGKIRFGEAKRIEAVTGLTFSEWQKQLDAGSASAAQAFIWVLMRRTNPDLRFDDIDDLELDDVEFVVPDTKKPSKKTAQAGPSVDPTHKAS